MLKSFENGKRLLQDRKSKFQNCRYPRIQSHPSILELLRPSKYLSIPIFHVIRGFHGRPSCRFCTSCVDQYYTMQEDTGGVTSVMLPSEHDFNGDMVGVPIEALVGPTEPIIGADSRFLACARHVFEKKIWPPVANATSSGHLQGIIGFLRHKEELSELSSKPTFQEAARRKEGMKPCANHEPALPLRCKLLLGHKTG